MRAIARTSHNGAVQACRLVMGHQPFPPEDALMASGTAYRSGFALTLCRHPCTCRTMTQGRCVLSVARPGFVFE